MHRLRVLRLVTVVLWLVTSLVHADAPQPASSSAEPEGYKIIINNAIEEFRRGNFEEAREQFARAHALFPSARTLRGLGMSEFELRNYVDAVERLEQALASDQRPLDGGLRAETQELLARANGYVGEVRLQVAPAAAKLHVDGFPAEFGHGARVRLSVGDHVLELSAEGYLSERRALKIRGEQMLDLKIALTQPRSGPGADEAQRSTSSQRDALPEHVPLYKRWWLWTSVGAVVAGGVIAGVLLAARGTRERDPYGGTIGDAIVVK